MGTDEPTAPERLPASLVESLDALDRPDLRAVRSYVEHRSGYLPVPLTDRVRANAPGEIDDVDDHGAYTLVRVRQETYDSSGKSKPVFLYRVEQERLPSGDETLHWSFLGEVSDALGHTCEKYGVAVSHSAAVCPRCGASSTGSGE